MLVKGWDSHWMSWLMTDYDSLGEWQLVNISSVFTMPKGLLSWRPSMDFNPMLHATKWISSFTLLPSLGLPVMHTGKTWFFGEEDLLPNHNRPVSPIAGRLSYCRPRKMTTKRAHWALINRDKSCILSAESIPPSPSLNWIEVEKVTVLLKRHRSDAKGLKMH